MTDSANDLATLAENLTEPEAATDPSDHPSFAEVLWSEWERQQEQQTKAAAFTGFDSIEMQEL